MASNEFLIIEQLKNSLTSLLQKDPSIIKNIGDDAAIVEIPPGQRLVISQDGYHQGTHFLKQQNIYDIVQHCLRAALSDLAAMGSLPKYMTISLSLEPHQIAEDYIQQLIKSIKDFILEFKVNLIGGDLTRGPCSITSTVFGWVPTDLNNGQGLLRNTAQVGDLIYTTRFPGTAYIGLQWLFAQLFLIENPRESEFIKPTKNPYWKIAIPSKVLNHHLTKDSVIGSPQDPIWQPIYQALAQPSLALDFAHQLVLRELSNTALDISDGVVGDLGQILTASAKSAILKPKQFKYHPAVEHLMMQGVLNYEQLTEILLYGGDDYQLLFTVSPDKQQQVIELAQELNTPIQQLGEIIAQDEQPIYLEQGGKLIPLNQVFEHQSYQAFTHD